ncbi:MAG: PIG-L family deacetylase [Acidobacteria bacterium]|nr:PIG-L family deacetylase [Acidobacteriota bacterium]
MPEDWARALAIVAHPDDMEYGAASAVARWTQQDKDISYLLVTRGEAGISSMPPEVVGPEREAEQRLSCAAVGVEMVEFLDHADGLVIGDIALRRDLAGAIRRHRPEVVLSINFRESWGGPSWNHVDHRVVGVAVLDAVRDAANPWVFTDLPGDAWDGVRFVAFSGSPQATHAVDVTKTMDAGVESLRCHSTYLANLGDDMANPGEFLRKAAATCGERIGVEYAASFEIIQP